MTDRDDRQPAIGGKTPEALAQIEQQEAAQAAQDADITTMVHHELRATHYRHGLLWDGIHCKDPKQAYLESRLFYGLVTQYLTLTGAYPGLSGEER